MGNTHGKVVGKYDNQVIIMAKKEETTEQKTKTSTPKTTTSDTSATAAAPSNGGGITTFIAAALVVGALVAGYFYLTNVDQDGPIAEENAEESVVDIVLGTDRESGPVARVNGVEIERKNYENSIASLAENAAAQGLDITDPTVKEQIKEQAITSLVNSEIFIQNAATAGISVPDETVASEFDTIVDNFGGEEALRAQLATFDVNQDDLRNDIREQLVIEAYIAAYVESANIEVSEEEITTFYDSLSASGQDVPTLEEVRTQIEAELIAQKQQALVAELLEKLRGESEVEVLV